MSIFPGKSALSIAKKGFTAPIKLFQGKNPFGSGKRNKDTPAPVIASGPTETPAVTGEILNTDINTIKRRRATASAKASARSALGTSAGVTSSSKLLG
jgi:hypothetical protein